MFRERWSGRWLRASLVVVCLAGVVQALHPHRAISEYIRDRWGFQKGLPGGAVYAITQTPDGYLWLGTEKGLVRFDGLNFKLFDQTNSNMPPGPVISLLVDSEGNLWIRPQSRNLLRYHDGQFEDAMPALDAARDGVTATMRGRNGDGLFAVRGAGIYSSHGGSFSRAISFQRLLVISMAQTSDGTYWLGTRDTGLVRLHEGKQSLMTKELPDTKINSLLAIDRQLWIGTDNGIALWNGNEITKTGLPEALNHAQVLSLIRDSDANVWIGTASGLVRLNSDGVASLAENGSRQSGAVSAIFEDREKNIWIGSSRGLEQLRDTIFLTYSASREPSASGSGSVYVDAQRRKWFAPSEGGLYWDNGQQVGQVKNDGLDRDVVYSLTGGGDELWIGRQHGGLTHLKYQGNSITTVTYTRTQGLGLDTVHTLYLSRDGAVWAGSLSGGVSRFKDGKFTAYTVANGLVSNTVTSITEGLDGTMWFATANGLSARSPVGWKTYGGLDGLPPGRMNSLFQDTTGTLWIGTDSGIAFLESGKVQVPRNVPDALHESVLGIVGDKNGYLWIESASHILRVNRERLRDGSINEADVREFGLADGLHSIQGLKRDRAVTVDSLGQIWFSTYGGLSVVDPAQIADTSVPALVHIEGVAADGTALDLPGPVRIQAGRQRITFSYAGLSLSIPERVRFRYKLDGFDHEWSAPGTAREAVFTNLGPGHYRFHVMASNSAGLWNGAESTIEFEVDPVFWQTGWFRLSVALAIGLAALLFYRLRVHRLTSQMNLRFEERLAERTRIAQDLHDTLLQGFLSASLQLHVADTQLPADSPGKPLVGRVLELMRQVIEEGRTTLKGLRSHGTSAPDLAQSFAGIQDELALHASVDYRVTVEGQVHPLRPFIRDDIYRIGREALVNAFRHSQANTIEVELEYGTKQLRILIRDDGRGIDRELLRSGRDGHWGIPGMRERADEIGATLKLWSRAGAGTEVELSVPGQIAYELRSAHRSRNWLARFEARSTNQDGRK